MYEKSLLSLANGMLDRDLFVHVDEVTRLRQRGWRPRGQVCEICRASIWGPGLGSQYWKAWEKKQGQDHCRRITRRLEGRVDPAAERGKGKAAAVADSHRYHHPHHTTADDSSGVVASSSAASAGAGGAANGAASGGGGVGTDDVDVDDDDEDPADPTSGQKNKANEQPTGGPLVIFSCRHLYHRDCLVAIGRPSRLATGAGTSAAGVGQALFFHPDGSGWVPSCPVCT